MGGRSYKRATEMTSASCIHGIDSRFCSICAGRAFDAGGTGRSPGTTEVNRQQRSSRVEKERGLSRIAHTFDGNESILTLKVDLDAGWTLHKRTWCFSEQLHAVESKFDQRLRIVVSVFHRPNWRCPRPRWQDYPRPVSEAEAAQVPDLAPTERVTLPQKLVPWFSEDVQEAYVDDPLGGEPVITLVLGGKKLQFRVLLFDLRGIFNPRLPWREKAGGKALFHTQYRDVKIVPPFAGLSHWEGPVSYEVQMLIVVEPPEKKPAPIYWDWNRRFFPGGLPSLNKRRR